MKLSECVWLRSSNNLDGWKPEPAPSDWSCNKWCNVEDGEYVYRVFYQKFGDKFEVSTHDKKRHLTFENVRITSVLELAAFLMDKRPA